MRGRGNDKFTQRVEYTVGQNDICIPTFFAITLNDQLIH